VSFLLLPAFLFIAGGAFAQPLAKDKDFLGYWKQSKQYHKIANEGIVVVDLPKEERFFVVWAPKVRPVDRVMVLLHGTGGTAYDEVADEISMAKKHGYALIGIQWLDKKTGRYDSAEKINRIVEKALSFYKKHNGSLKTVALSGFSRGGAISYEVAYLDNQGENNLKLIIAHSGGIPLDNVVAPREDNTPGKFYSDLTTGRLGNSGFKDKDFFLYAGCQDKQWGSTMCEKMEYTKGVIEKNGGSVVGCIIDQQGKHGGYRSNQSYHEQAIQFLLNR